MKKFGIFALPLLAFVLTGVFLYSGLYSNPTERESSLLDRPLPDFQLPDVMDPTVIYDPTLFDGQVTLLNVWGTWCVTCAVELPYLTALREQGVRIVGLYYETDLDPDFGGKTLQAMRSDIDKTLSRLGNPYERNVFDERRDYALELGVTGAPETFVIDKTGHIRLHHIGDVNERVWQQKIGPVYQELLAQ